VSEQEMGAEEINNVLRLVAAKELQRSNQILEALHDHVTILHQGVEQGEYKEPLDVIDQVYNWIREAFTSNIAAAHHDNIVSKEEFVDAVITIHGVERVEAEKLVAEIRDAYEQVDQSDA
jgi:hypothetical protein